MHRSHAHRYLLALLLTLTSITVFHGESSAEAKIPVRIGVQPNILPEGILRAQGTLEKKYGDKYSFTWIDVTHAAPAIEGMIAESIDITDAGVLPLIEGRARGLDYWAVADAVGDVTGLVVDTNSNIKAPADLKGRKIAYPGKGSWQYGLLLMALEGTGVTIDQIQLVGARFPEMPLLLQKKAVDGFAGVEPFMSMVIAKGEARLLFRPSSQLAQKENTLISGHVVVRPDFARQHPDALRAFLKEFGDASRFVKNDPKEAAAIYHKLFPTVVTEEVFLQALRSGLVYLEDIKPRAEDWVKFVTLTNRLGLTKIGDPEGFARAYIHPEFAE
jgi:ABC-type nitrate/sulfonate/bicarbonate transport system substrate-binding protein